MNPVVVRPGLPRSSASSSTSSSRRLCRLATLSAALALLGACGGGGGAGPDAPATTATAQAGTDTTTDTTADTATESPELATPGLKWRGVNLSGAEYNSTALPGRYGYQYFYPSPSAVDYFQAKGMNLVRVPFLWERVQPTLYAPLDATELQRLKAFVDAATAKGVTVLIDPHDYGRYRQQVIGSAGVPYSAFGDFWSRLATTFKGNPQVLFGLMNEPYGMTTENWVNAANEAIRRIRAAGATNTIAVPGNAWSGAYSWEASYYGTPNAQAMLQVVDSGHNMVFEVHQYLDADSSGTSSTCVSPTIGAQRLAVFTAWLRANGRRGLLGEFAAANNSTCHQALDGMLAYMQTHSDVWVGWSYWLGGAWSSNDAFSIQPVGGVDKPQMQTLAPYLD
ncbi:MAG: glycoside hydrolase family 5 protein [Rhizobacter sp.]|nr:glycoside hydrolase family 5 protein [Rhizobacter sp.]